MDPRLPIPPPALEQQLQLALQLLQLWRLDLVLHGKLNVVCKMKRRKVWQSGFRLAGYGCDWTNENAFSRRCLRDELSATIIMLRKRKRRAVFHQSKLSSGTLTPPSFSPACHSTFPDLTRFSLV
jgi:hypothetical protein